MTQVPSRPKGNEERGNIFNPTKKPFIFEKIKKLVTIEGNTTQKEGETLETQKDITERFRKLPKPSNK